MNNIILHKYIDHNSTLEFIHLIVFVAMFECKYINPVFINKKPIYHEDIGKNGNVIRGIFTDLIKINKHFGTNPQEVDKDLLRIIPYWTKKHFFNGMTYMYIRLKYNPIFYTGLPTIEGIGVKR